MYYVVEKLSIILMIHYLMKTTILLNLQYIDAVMAGLDQMAIAKEIRLAMSVSRNTS